MRNLISRTYLVEGSGFAYNSSSSPKNKRSFSLPNNWKSGMVTDALLPVLDSLKSLDFCELDFEDLFFVVLRLPPFLAPFFLEVVLRFLVVFRFFVEDFLFVVFLFVDDFFFVVVVDVVVDEVFVELEAFLFQQKNTKCISSVSKIHQNEFSLLYRRRE